MINSEVKKELLQRMDHLSFASQKQLLGYVSMVDRRARGVKGKNLLSFAGSIDGDDLKAIKKFIETGCESVDSNAW